MRAFARMCTIYMHMHAYKKYARICVYMHIYARICINVRSYTNDARIYMHMHTYTRIRAHTFYMRAYACKYIYICTHRHAYFLYECICIVHMRAYASILYMRVYTRILFIYMHTFCIKGVYAYAHICTYIHAYKRYARIYACILFICVHMDAYARIKSMRAYACI